MEAFQERMLSERALVFRNVLSLRKWLKTDDTMLLQQIREFSDEPREYLLSLNKQLKTMEAYLIELDKQISLWR